MRFLPEIVLALAAFTGAERQTVRDERADRDAIRVLLERFVDAWNRGDVDLAASVYADPHVDVNAPVPLESAARTRARWKGFFERYHSRITVTSDELILAGPWAFQRGVFEQSVMPRAGGTTTTVRRRYIEVLKKTHDGWRVFWGIDGPVAEESLDP